MVRGQSLVVLFVVVLTAILAPFLTILHSSSSREMQRTMLPSNTSEQTDHDGDEYDGGDGGDDDDDAVQSSQVRSKIRTPAQRSTAQRSGMR